MHTRNTSLVFVAPLAVLAITVASPASGADDIKTIAIPTCDRIIGTLAVTEPENKWWLAYELESPEALIKVFVSESKCFTLLDRGKGLAAAQQERALSAGGEMRVGSNIGKGQMKAADYVLVPDVVTKNKDSGGKKIGGILGGLIGGVAGAVVGGINLKSKEADVVLTLTDVRSTEQVALEQGHAKKTDLGWGAGGGAFFGGFAAAGATSYANTDIGQVVTMAYLDSYAKLVTKIKGMSLNAKADNVSQSVTMAKPGRMYTAPNIKASVVRDLDPGMMMYPTGEKDGMWWKVSDELGNEGWVPSTLFQLAR
ncbi:MAG: peptidoglycan-binding protein [Gammaproteobacteria bacterium]|nr:peptidoglycan-binding protein [Gammaproteobacteria bacterium]